MRLITLSGFIVMLLLATVGSAFAEEYNIPVTVVLAKAVEVGEPTEMDFGEIIPQTGADTITLKAISIAADTAPSATQGVLTAAVGSDTVLPTNGFHTGAIPVTTKVKGLTMSLSFKDKDTSSPTITLTNGDKQLSLAISAADDGDTNVKNVNDAMAAGTGTFYLHIGGVLSLPAQTGDTTNEYEGSYSGTAVATITFT